jgi:hypothetical protein
MAEDDTFTFGKYKGRSLSEVMARDPQYLQWLTGQAWFVNKYESLAVTINNFGAVPEETPEHNKMQMRFLDEGYRVALAAAIGLLEEQRVALTQSKYTPPADKAKIATGEAEWVVRAHKLEFETPLGDVVFQVDTIIEPRPQKYDNNERTPIAVEIKPSMGDDFPAVLRQMKRQYTYSNRQILLIREYAGSGATLEQVRKAFAANGVTLVLANEVEAQLEEAGRVVEASRRVISERPYAYY